MAPVHLPQLRSSEGEPRCPPFESSPRGTFPTNSRDGEGGEKHLSVAPLRAPTGDVT